MHPDRFREGLCGCVDDLSVAGRLVAGAEAEQGLEGGVRVVAKDELVEVGLQVRS